MMKAVLLENEKFNWAMTDLVELKGLIEDKLIDNDDEVIETIKNILKTFDEAASIAEPSENGERFEIINAEKGTFMEIKYGDELES